MVPPVPPIASLEEPLVLKHIVPTALRATIIMCLHPDHRGGSYPARLHHDHQLCKANLHISHALLGGPSMQNGSLHDLTYSTRFPLFALDVLIAA